MPRRRRRQLSLAFEEESLRGIVIHDLIIGINLWR
jgi:hypothetical protein